MKTIITTCFFLFSITIFSQNLKNDSEFFKSSTFIYTTLQNFDEVYKAEERGKEKINRLPSLKNNIANMNASYNLLKNKYSKDEDFKQFDLWVQGINTYYKMLQDNDETWMLGFSLTKLDITEFFSKKY